MCADLTPGNILLKLDKGVEPVALVAKLAVSVRCINRGVEEGQGGQDRSDVT